MSEASEAEIETQDKERQNGAREPNSQNVANPFAGDAGAGVIGERDR